MSKGHKLTQEELISKRVTVRKQIEEALDTGNVTCSCNKILKVLYSFKCFYCGEYYCHDCASEHFE